MPKYGCISLIKRNGQPVTITIVDPPRENIKKSKEDRILDLLIYYTKCIQLSGFYNLARHLNERINQIIINRQMVERYRNMPIEYGNVIKAGYGYEISIGNNIRFKVFVARNMQAGLKRKINYHGEEYVLVFGMDPHLIEIVEKQDFDSLLQYSIDVNLSVENDVITTSVHNDGTFLSILSKEIFHVNI